MKFEIRADKGILSQIERTAARLKDMGYDVSPMNIWRTECHFFIYHSVDI